MNDRKHLSRLKRRRIAAGVAVGALAASISIAPIAGAGPKKKDKVEAPVQLVVKVNWGQDPAEVASGLGADLVDTLILSRRIVLLEFDVKDEKAALKLVEKDSRVSWAEPNYVGSSAEAERFHAWPSETPPQTSTQEQWENQPGLATLGLDAAHQISTGSGVQVAVLDTGVDAAHPALAGKVVPKFDFIDDDNMPDDTGNGLDDDGDGFVDEAAGHGTHVAGIVHLLAPAAEIYSYRVLDSDGQGTVFGVAEAITDAVDSGADVINLSFGTDHKLKSKVLKSALDYAKANNVIVIAAAGNDGSDKARYPAAEGSVLAVSAVDAARTEFASFASRGKWVTVAAPGVDITSTVPGGGYATWSGSSMAAPVVAGQAALVKQLQPDISHKDLAKLIGDNTTKLNGKNNKDDPGLLDLAASLEKGNPNKNDKDKKDKDDKKKDDKKKDDKKKDDKRK